MRRTLLLCFIHGFKGDDNTFGGFPEHLRALISHTLPKINVKAVTYPQFDTRGDLGDCVTRFREWLQNIVIDLEVSAGTPSPTIDPSVRTVLVGHSMGGIVAAETLLHIISDEPIPPSSSKLAFSEPPAPSSAAHTTLSSTSTSNPDPHKFDEASNTFIFPYIQGILAFDTPYLGLSPSLIAHGAETHYRSASSAYSALTDLAGVFGYGASTNSSPNAKQKANPKAGALPPAPPEHAKDGLSASMTAPSQDAAATPTWQRLGRYAMFAGAAGAVAAGGAAAYLKADTLSTGWNWVGSHLEFVGCLVRGEELKSRLDRVITLGKEKGIGFADLFTVLGRGADKGGVVAKGGEEKRTFCNIPKTKRLREGYWFPEINEKAKEETAAHMSMFAPKENPGYYGMCERAKGLVVGWVERGGWDPSGGEEGIDGDKRDGGEEGVGDDDKGQGRGQEDTVGGWDNGMVDVDIDMEKDAEMGFGTEKEGVLWGDGIRHGGEDDNPWIQATEEGEKGLEGEESVIVEKR
ncbi:MAG: hypothetical protein Q9181_006350 [Wetmoreana brouardii]